MNGLGARSLSVIDNELFGGIVRRRFQCVNPSCPAPLEDRCDFATHVVLDVPTGGEEVVSLRDLWAAKVTADPDCQASGTPGRGCCGTQGKLDQAFLEKEPPCLIICLQRIVCDGAGGQRKVCRRVSFPPRLEWLRSGVYECAGVVHHRGKEAHRGHYTATCQIDRSAGQYGDFDDDKPVRRKAWSFLEEPRQQRDAYVLLYVRVASHDHADPSMSRPLPYEVGEASERLGVRGSGSDEVMMARAAQPEAAEVVVVEDHLDAAQQARIEANRARALELRVKRLRLSAPGAAGALGA